MLAHVRGMGRRGHLRKACATISRVTLRQRQLGRPDRDDRRRSAARAKRSQAAMRSFLDQPGIPLVHTELRCKDGKATLGLSQSRYLPFGVLGEGKPHGACRCARVRARRRVEQRNVSCSTRPSSASTVAGGCPDWYLPNAQARGYYRFDMAPADLASSAARSRSSTAPEQVIYADALTSAFHRGDAAVPPPYSRRCRRSRRLTCRKSRRRCSTRSSGSARNSPTTPRAACSMPMQRRSMRRAWRSSAIAAATASEHDDRVAPRLAEFLA